MKMVKNCDIIILQKKVQIVAFYILNCAPDIFIVEKEVGGGWCLTEGGSRNF